MKSLLRASLLMITFLLTDRVCVASAATPIYGAGYWTNFVEHWKNALYKQNAIVLGTVLLGAICIFILTRSKAKE